MAAPTPTADPALLGQRRLWRVGHNAGAQVIARVISSGCQVLLVPWMISQLGVESYGWTMALVAMVGLSQFADLGVTMAFQQALSEAWARGDETGLKKIYASGARLLAYLGVAWFVVVMPTAWLLGEKILAAPPGAGSHTQWSWLVVAAAMAVGIPLSAGLRLAAALQLSWIAAFWTAACNVLMLVVAWTLARPGVQAGALGYVVLLSVAQIAPGWLCALHLRRRLRWTKAIPADTREVRQLWRDALPFATQSLAGALLQAATPWAFARFGGYSATAAFAVLQRLFGLAQQAHALILGPLWPAYAEAKVRGDKAWIKRTFRLSLLLTLPVVAGVLGLAALLPWILRLWLGAGTLVPGPGLAWPIALWVVTAIVGQPLVLLLLGLSRIQRTAISVMIAHVLTMAAMIGLGNYFGGTGVALGLSGGLTLGVLPLYVRETFRALRELPESESTTRNPAAKF